MATKSSNQSIAGRMGKKKPTTQDEGAFTPARPAVPRLAARSCCCLAKPVVVAVIPITGHDRQPVDIHLCAHHYQLSRDALNVADAIVFDGSGVPVTDPDPRELLRAAR
ncbi:hypothetical protein [Actinomadura madurae]|uniref:hypothetical protein n=1 Tax=Actinomadura madurae TaxID=1993 RepID=UPI000D91903B|nr:hypothetical protein [Actinomadura madurae]SPT51139.1 Uncharacterised protein [Actinomadura madurae]